MRIVASRTGTVLYAAPLLAAAGLCFALAHALPHASPSSRSLSAPGLAASAIPHAPAPAIYPGHAAALSRRAPLPGPFAVEMLRVVDGDTFEGRMRIWFGQEITVLVRLRNVDAPELKARCESEARLALEARQTLEEILRSGTIVVSDIALDKYAGRIVADVGIIAGRDGVDDVGDLLQAGGYARPYRGGRRAGWCS